MLIQSDQTWLKNAETVFRSCRRPEDFGHILCKWDAHVGQVNWLNRPKGLHNNLLLTGRRWGKSECEAIDMLHYSLFHPDSHQGIVSITLDQARIIWDQCLKFLTESPLLHSLVAKTKETPFPLLMLKNRSTIEVRTAAREGIYIRGHKFDRVTVDEADYLDRQTIDDVVRMTLADVGGPLTLCTTPKAKRGLCYELYRLFQQQGIASDIYAQIGPSFENPHLDHDYINGLKDKLTRDGWKREILGVYADDDAAVFRFEDIQWSYMVEPAGAIDQGKSGYGVIINKPPQKDRRYYGGWDLAKSIDHTVGFVVDATTDPHRIVYMERTQKLPWPAITKRIEEIHNMYGCTESYYDATGIGAYNKDVLDGFCLPFTFTKQSKIDLLTILQLQLEKRKLTFPFVRQLVDELQDYEWEDKNLPDTDCVMALALAEWQGGGQDTVEVIPALWS